MSGKPPDCIKCGYVIIIPENYKVMEIIVNNLNYMLDGMGGINTQGVSQVLKWENVKNQRVLAQKILFYLIAYLTKRQEEK